MEIDMQERVQNKNQQAIDEFRMFDDTFMSAVFDGKTEETEFLIRVILNREDIKVYDSKAQFFMSNIYGRGLRLDILARDEQGDRYTIFITEEDEFEEGLPLYHAEYTVSELKHSPLGDGSFIIYVNGQYRNTDTPIGKLMHDFSCSKADDILNPILRERVRTLKETERGREEVCKIMENRITEEKIELAKNAIKSGELTLEQIAKVLDLSLPIVEELARTQAVGA